MYTTTPNRMYEIDLNCPMQNKEMCLHLASAYSYNLAVWIPAYQMFPNKRFLDFAVLQGFLERWTNKSGQDHYRLLSEGRLWLAIYGKDF